MSWNTVITENHKLMSLPEIKLKLNCQESGYKLKQDYLDRFRFNLKKNNSFKKKMFGFYLGFQSFTFKVKKIKVGRRRINNKILIKGATHLVGCILITLSIAHTHEGPFFTR